jgi:hypothetical protein
LIYGAGRHRSRQATIVGTIVLAILAATLIPSRNGPLRPFSSCFVCDFRWLADGVLNVGLFLPLGMAITWRGKSFWRATLAGAVLSTAVELLQTLIPGRDPELRDIVANTIGAALGAALIYRPRTWLVPTARGARWLSALTAVGIAGLIVATGILLAPARFDGPLRVTRTESDAIVRYQSRADVIGLDQPAYYVRGIFAGIDASIPVQVDASRGKTGLCLNAAGMQRCRIGPTPGRGWAVLIYPSAIPHRWADDLIDAAWMALLFFPLGFWTTRRSLVFSVGAAVLLLGALPLAVGLVATTLPEWLGACVGLVVGYAAAHAVRRRLEVVRASDIRRTHPQEP